MSLYAIGDLHFSTLVEKPMNIFGDKWDKHEEKIISSWKDNVKEDDVVLVLGDTSWGINLTEAKPDLDIISNLCGNKIFIKGNHDYWWTTVTNLNKLYDNMKFLQTNFYEYGEYAICGGRGWICPNDFKFDDNDEKIYKRELIRMKASLDKARAEAKDEDAQIIAAVHYPPVSKPSAFSGFQQLFEDYGVKRVIYGHIHGEDGFRNAVKGLHHGVEYSLVSLDYLDCMPLKI